MGLLPIRIFGDPVLRERAAEVETFDAALSRLADDMLETMRAAAGAGLAGNQVGILKRLFTYDDGEEAGAFVNPVVEELSEELQDGEEGCLSFPGLFYPTKRPLRVRMTGQTQFGEEKLREAEGLAARIFLHELDHLNGVLFIDHLARHDRKEAMKRIRAGELEHPPPPEEATPEQRETEPGPVA